MPDAKYCARCGELIDRRNDLIAGRLVERWVHVSPSGAYIYRQHVPVPEAATHD